MESATGRGIWLFEIATGRQCKEQGDGGTWKCNHVESAEVLVCSIRNKIVMNGSVKLYIMYCRNNAEINMV